MGAIAESSGGSLASSDEGSEPTEDELFEVISNRRRRYALHALSARESAELGELAEQIAAWENDTSVAEVTSRERKRVYTALQQSHLPKMDDVGVVEFDKRAGTVEPAPVLDDLDVYLEITRDNDIPWSEYYLGLSAVGVALVTALWADAVPFAALSDLAWLAFLVAALFVSALTHYYHTRQMKLGSGDRPPNTR